MSKALAKHLMKTTEQSTVKYQNPPINEIVCGIRFDSIKQLQSGHLGILWQKFRSDFPRTEDHNLVGPVSEEDLGTSDKMPLPRVWFVHRNENELIQVQRNRFLHNWRKIQPNDEYPGYAKVVGNFEKHLSCFKEFIAEENLGNLVLREYELTYIDLIPKGHGWENPSDLATVFPNLLSATRQSVLLKGVQGINWQTIFGLPKGLGQLVLLIRNAQRRSDNQQLLQIEFKALSSGSYKPIRGWFNTAHNAITQLFSSIVSDEIQEKFWGRKL